MNTQTSLSLALARSLTMSQTAGEGSKRGFFGRLFRRGANASGQPYADDGRMDPHHLVALLKRKKLSNPEQLFDMKRHVPLARLIEAPGAATTPVAGQHTCLFTSENWVMTRALGIGRSGLVIAMTPDKYELRGARFLACKMQLSEPEETRAAKQELIVLELLMGLVIPQAKTAITERWTPFVKLYDYTQCSRDVQNLMLNMRPSVEDSTKAAQVDSVYKKMVGDLLLDFMIESGMPHRACSEVVGKHIPRPF